MSETQFFFDLTPDLVLSAVERSGLVCTGRCFTLNSFENRVYDVEIEVDDPSQVKTPSDRFRVVKFYRPGRWSEEQILEEHGFLLDLVAAEVPVIAPLPFADGKTLHKDPTTGIFYAVFPKRGGRAPDELSVDQLKQVGRLLARIHQVGARRGAKQRLHLTPQTYGIDNLNTLIATGLLPPDFVGALKTVVERLVERMTPDFESIRKQLVHGDCHLGNLLWSQQGPFFLDFDDSMIAPCMQDIWLIAPGRDTYAQEQREILIDSYQMMRDFDRRELKLVEPLRALRRIYFATWIAKRWKDPAFPRAFPQFGTNEYWRELYSDLEEIYEIMCGV